MLNPIVYAVPVFLALIALEWHVSRRRGLPVYRAADTVASLSLGILSQLVGVFAKVATLGIYVWVWQHAALWQLPASSPWVWIGALLAYDFCYYWIHRWGHEVNILWAAHVVHHSSEDYNLGTALRQTGTGFLFGWIVYLPMAVAGVPPLVFVTVGLIDLLYQFWVHTRLVGRLGWMDRVFVTPSNHRVHHGQNGWCLDRNYGGILILWDRLFGTFVDEHGPESRGEAIVYGIRGPIRSFNPLWANAHFYADRLRDARLAARQGDWLDMLRLPFMHPGWRPAAAWAADPQPPYDITQFQRYAPPLPAPLGAAQLVQLAALLLLGVHFLAIEPQLGRPAAVAMALLLTWQLAWLSRLGDRGLSAGPGQWLRWAIGAALLAASPWHGWPWLLLWLAAGAVMAWAWPRARAHDAHLPAGRPAA